MKWRHLLPLFLAFAIAESKGYAQQYVSPLSPNAQEFIKWGDSWFESNKSRLKSKMIERYWDSNCGNQHEIRTGSVPGVQAKYVYCPTERTTYLMSLSVTSQALEFPFGIRIRCTAKDIEKRLGPPSKSTPKQIEFEEGDPFIDSATFYLKNGQLFKVVWYFELD
jgi:hypothetical protein